MKLIPQLLRLQMTLDGLQFLAVARALYAGFGLQNKKLHTKMRCEYYKIRLFIFFLGRCLLYMYIFNLRSLVRASVVHRRMPPFRLCWAAMWLAMHAKLSLLNWHCCPLNRCIVPHPLPRPVRRYRSPVRWSRGDQSRTTDLIRWK